MQRREFEPMRKKKRAPRPIPEPNPDLYTLYGEVRSEIDGREYPYFLFFGRNGHLAWIVSPPATDPLAREAAELEREVADRKRARMR